MKVRSKIYLFIAAATLVLTVLLVVSAVYGFGEYSRAVEREHGRMAAELVRNELLMRLTRGALDEQDLYSALSGVIPALHSIRIVRTQAVIDEYGMDDDSPLSEIERRALDSRTPIGTIVENEEGVFFQYVAPYLAESTDLRDCLQCHDVRVGTALGAVNLKLDLTGQRSQAMRSTAAIVVLVLLFAAMLAYFLHRLLLPIVSATAEMQEVVGQAERGDFSGRMQVRSSDEIGRIAEQTNHLMTALEQSFGTIVREVETLSTDRRTVESVNLLDHTVATVEGMVEAARFRQTIENDRHANEVYQRLRKVLQESFELKAFSLYESVPGKDRLSLVFAEGLPQGSGLWCDPEILAEGSACRAMRTGQEASSLASMDVCSAFFGNHVQVEQDLQHVCLPILFGGSVGGVLQIVIERSEEEDIQDRLHRIRRYLREAAPVIESKRLTQVLKDSSLRDPLSGLYNRRFLEQFVERLSALAQRRDGSLSLLMCDLDSFKQLNDSMGHQGGDSVIRETAEIINRTVRLSDYVIRMGGDEFLGILVDAADDVALDVAERVRGGVEKSILKFSTETLARTVSIGVSIYPDDSDSFLECLRLADKALFVAKESGGNRVVRYRPDLRA